MGTGNRIREWRDKRGMTLEELADRAGFSPSYLSRMESGGRNVSLKNLTKLSVALGVDTTELVASSGKPSSPLQYDPQTRIVPIVGKVAAGVFREVMEFDDEEPPTLLAERDEEFPNARMFALEVEGDSMNDASPPIFEGSRVICVDFEETGLPIQDGMLVVVERTRDAGLSREWSVKQVEYHEDRVEYHPRSTNRRHKPIVVPHDASPEDAEVRVMGLVRQVNYAVPLRPKRKT